MAQEIADSTLLDTWGSGGNIVEPDISKIIEGWQLGEQPPHEYMNWLQNTFGSKLNHILKNGVASWNNETQYLAGSSVQHNGNVWLCKTTNTNSEPADVNSNWKRIITVESLTTVLNGYVKNSGDETIAGVKTFSSSPIVPTPTTGTQAVNKDYVDNVAVFDINSLTNKITPVDTDNLALQETGGLLKKVSFENLKKHISGQVIQSSTVNNMVVTVGNTDVDWNDLQATITPKNTASKILVTVTFGVGNSNADGGVYLKRNSTKIGGTGLTSTWSHPDNIWNIDEITIGNINILPITIKYLDSPASIAPITYKIGIRIGGGSSFYLNQASAGVIQGNFRATITLEEIL